MEIAVHNCWIPFKNQQSKFVRLFTEYPEILECDNEYLQDYDTPILRNYEGITSRIADVKTFGELYDLLRTEQEELRKRSFRHLKPRRIEVRNGKFGVVCDNTKVGDFPLPKNLILFGHVPDDWDAYKVKGSTFESSKYGFPIVAFIVD